MIILPPMGPYRRRSRGGISEEDLKFHDRFIIFFALSPLIAVGCAALMFYIMYLCGVFEKVQ